MTKKRPGGDGLSHDPVPRRERSRGDPAAARVSCLAAILTILGLTALTPAVGADVLLIKEVRQVERMDLPQNGLSKADVEARFGTPEIKHEPVGDPPITRWQYGDYSVYFEFETVLFSVLHSGAVIEDGA
jgi:hypothetical protein